MEIRILPVILLMLLLRSTSAQNVDSQNTPPQGNDLTRLLFEQMYVQGIDLSKPLTFGYFFFDAQQEDLKSLSDMLQSEGYTQINLSKAEDEQYSLHMQKAEALDGSSMVERGNWLRSLAQKHKVALYDGWDVGALDTTKPLTTDAAFQDAIKKLADEDLFARAQRLYDFDMFEQALFAFNLCIDKGLVLDTSYYKRGFCLRQLREPQQSLSSYLQALKTNPNYLKAAFNAAATYYNLADYQNCIKYYQKVLSLDENNDQAWYGIAAAQYALEDREASKQSCNKALEINPDNQMARQMLKYFK